MKNLFSTLFFLAAFLTVGSLQAQNPNIVSNASFELNNSSLSSTAHASAGSVNGVNYQNFNATFTDWSGNAIQVLNNLQLSNGSPLSATDGYQYITLHNGSGVDLSQTLNVTPGTTYYVCANGASGSAIGGATIRIDVDGSTLVDYTTFDGQGGSGTTPSFSPSSIGSFTPTTNTVEFVVAESLTSPYNGNNGNGTSGTLVDYVYVGTANYCPATASELPPDADSDGVADANDNCPGTPSGTTVDAQGCPDTDGDAAVGLADPDGSDPCNPDSNDAACGGGPCGAGSTAPTFGGN